MELKNIFICNTMNEHESVVRQKVTLSLTLHWESVNISLSTVQTSTKIPRCPSPELWAGSGRWRDRRPPLANWLSLAAVVFEWRGGALSEARPEERQEKGRIAGRKNQLHSSRPGLATATARIFPSFREEILDISGSGCSAAKCWVNTSGRSVGWSEGE